MIFTYQTIVIFLLDQIRNKELDPISKNEFVSAGFVSGHNTLFTEINVTQAGELLSYKDGIISNEIYFNYSINVEDKGSYTDLRFDTQQIIDNTFSRLINSLNGRMAVIPLSGGFDSRLIACKLKELGYKNILCYTFGKSKDNSEKATSEKVAKKLGLNWVFIEYNSENIGEYINSKDFIDYYRYYTQYSSSFMFQDYFAVKYLTENKIIPQNAIFIPGYSGDFLGGSQLYKNGNTKYEASTSELARKIFEERYINTKIKKIHQTEIIQKIENQLIEKVIEEKKYLAYSIFENWEIKENLSKFIGQASHIYSFFGYEYRLPFWDGELVNFFKYIPYKLKFGKIFYDDILKSNFSKLGVNYHEGSSLTKNQFRIYRIKKQLKNIPLPKNRIEDKIDTLNYEFIL
ncbi:MAG: asparagine synthase C-terminal domain-containing protein [Ignavibacteriales bacterium]|nr:asparagine synthase C-terminal domain-containing protein [Ignavibacteriales bacterium]